MIHWLTQEIALELKLNLADREHLNVVLEKRMQTTNSLSLVSPLEGDCRWLSYFIGEIDWSHKTIQTNLSTCIETWGFEEFEKTFGVLIVPKEKPRVIKEDIINFDTDNGDSTS